MRAQGGLSVLELMVALAVAALLLSVGVPSFTTTTKNATIVSAANGFLSDLHYARDLAVTRNQRVVVCASSSGTSCNSADWAEGWLVFVDLDNDGALDAGEPVERVAQGTSPRLSLQPLNFGNKLTYRPNGRAMGATITAETGAFVMCDDRGSPHARAIMVDYGGRPRVTHLAKIGITAPCP